MLLDGTRMKRCIASSQRLDRAGRKRERLRRSCVRPRTRCGCPRRRSCCYGSRPGSATTTRFCALSQGTRNHRLQQLARRRGARARCANWFDTSSSTRDLPIADIAYLRLGPWQESVAHSLRRRRGRGAARSRSTSRSPAARSPNRCICSGGSRAAWAGRRARRTHWRLPPAKRFASRCGARESPGASGASPCARRTRRSSRK